MSSKPAAIPLFADAYLADTMHLTTEEHGAYLLLLMAAWRQDDCSLPNDDRKLARIAGLSARKWVAMRDTVLDFWTVESDRIFQARLRKERGYVLQKSEANRKNVSKRWQAQAAEKQHNGQYDRIYEHDTPPPPPPPTYQEETEVSSKARKRATKVEAFPCPEWADPAVWSDLLSIRKEKRLTNTATAHKQFVKAIERMSDDEWPPGRLLEGIVSLSWGGAYDPRPKLQEQQRKSGNGHGNSGAHNYTDERDGAFAELARRATTRYSGEASGETGRSAVGPSGTAGQLALTPPAAGRARQG